MIGFKVDLKPVLEKEMATHSSTLAWNIPQTEEPGRLQSMGSQRVGHNYTLSLSLSQYACSSAVLASSVMSNYL